MSNNNKTSSSIVTQERKFIYLNWIIMRDIFQYITNFWDINNVIEAYPPWGSIFVHSPYSVWNQPCQCRHSKEEKLASVIFAAARSNCFLLLVTLAKINRERYARDLSGQTILHYAIKLKRWKIVHWLINNIEEKMSLKTRLYYIKQKF